MLKENKKEAFRLFLDYIFENETEQKINKYSLSDLMLTDISLKLSRIDKKLDEIINKNTGKVYIDGEEVGELTDVEIEPAPTVIKNKIADMVSIGNTDNIELTETKKDYGIRKRRKEPKNKTGIYRVSYKNNGTWTYKYGQSSINSVDLNELEKKVKAEGLKWIILDKEKAEQSYKKNEENIKEKFNKKATRSKSGIAYVTCNKDNLWQYTILNPYVYFSDKNLKVLEKKVKDAGYKWKILDKEKAEYSYKHNKPKTKNQNASGIRKRKVTGIKREDLKNEDNLYTYPISYMKPVKINLRDDGQFTVNKGTQAYDNILLLKIFYNTQPNLKIRDFNRLKKLESYTSRQLIMRIAYYFDKELRNGGGDFCDIIYTIFKNDYEVPKFVSFTSNGKELLVNEHKTGILLGNLKNWVDELNDSFNQEFAITKIMHDNPDVNQRFLFYTLMNFGNQHIIDILSEADL